MIQSLREKGVAGSCEWYRFLRSEGIPDTENVESLKVNGAVVTDKEEMRRVIRVLERLEVLVRPLMWVKDV